MEIRYWKENKIRIVSEGGKKIMYIPESKFKALFPLAYRRGLEVVVVHDDGEIITVSTYLPEQKKPRLKKVPRALLFGDVKKLTEIIPPRE